MNVVDIALQIIEMKRTIDAQEQEIKRLKRVEVDYEALLRSSNKHNAVMAMNTLNLCMTPGPGHAHLIEQLKAALTRIADWPDGGNLYGQDNIKSFAAKTLEKLL